MFFRCSSVGLCLLLLCLLTPLHAVLIAHFASFVDDADADVLGFAFLICFLWFATGVLLHPSCCRLILGYRASRFVAPFFAIDRWLAPSCGLAPSWLVLLLVGFVDSRALARRALALARSCGVG